MKYFQVHPEDGFEWINSSKDEGDPATYDEYSALLELDGRPRATEWKPIEVRRVRADPRQRKRDSDFPWIGSALVMRRAAVDALKDLLDESKAEVLPLTTCDDVPLSVLNACALDALDFERSSVLFFPKTSRIMAVNKAVLRRSVVAPFDVFRLSHRAGEIYVSERFVERVKSHKLRGLSFLPVETV